VLLGMEQMPLTIEQLLNAQNIALQTGNKRLLNLAWVGLGYHRDVSFVQASMPERQAACTEITRILRSC
jgi:hypothetical protein